MFSWTTLSHTFFSLCTSIIKLFPQLCRSRVRKTETGSLELWSSPSFAIYFFMSKQTCLYVSVALNTIHNLFVQQLVVSCPQSRISPCAIVLQKLVFWPCSGSFQVRTWLLIMTQNPFWFKLDIWQTPGAWQVVLSNSRRLGGEKHRIEMF